MPTPTLSSINWPRHERASSLIPWPNQSGSIRLGARCANSKVRQIASAVYTDSFLQKFKEIDATQNIPVQNVRILTRATPPLDKGYKKSAAVVAGGIILGLFLGTGAAIGKEWAADVFRFPRIVEQVTDTHCDILPMVKANRKRAWFQDSTKSLLIGEYVLDAPYSRFAENLRNVKALIDATPGFKRLQGNRYRVFGGGRGQDDCRG